MTTETRWAVAAILSAICVALAVGEEIAQRYFDTTLCSSFRIRFWSGILVLLPLSLHSCRRSLRYRRARKLGAVDGPVYPHRDYLFGTDFLGKVKQAFAETRLLEWWHEVFLECGRTYWVNALGSWTVMTCDSENIKTILSTDFDAWPIGGIRQRTVLLTLGPEAIFSTNGAKWKHARSIMRPSFVRNQISDMACTDRHVETFLAKIPRDGSPFDMQDLLYKFTMDGSTDFMFGRSTNILSNPTPEAQKFTECFDYANFAAAKSGRLGWLAMFIPNKKMSDAIAYCRTFVENHVEDALAQDKAKERSYVFMNELIDSGASHDAITAQLLSMILGGRDTSASTMSSMFWELSRRPDIVEKLRKDIATLGGRKPTWEELKDLKYLNFVLKETLRLWAPVATNMRLSGKDTILPRGGGPDGMSPMFVPKNVGIRYSTYSMHRDPKLYGEDANEFNPDRWENMRTSWEYLPFSGGPRICIGQQFALTQMQYLVTRFFQTFETVDAADDKPMKQILSATISLKHGCWLSVQPVAA